MEDQFERTNAEFEVRNSINKKRNVGGRPRKPIDQLRTVRISVGYTPDQADALTNRALALNLRDVDLIRMLSLTEPLPQPAVDRELIAEINKIGININQIAKVANTAGATALAQLAPVLESIESKLFKIGQAIYGQK